jgi:hypothetical protein
MNAMTPVKDVTGQATLGIDNEAFGFVPQGLATQCQVLIESFHDLHGYACLPDILWKAGLGPFIESHRELRDLLRKASTSRSAKKSNQGFARIATQILSLEILASHFGGWNALYPEATVRAQSILENHARSSQMLLLDFYLYPPKYANSAAVAALVPPGHASHKSAFVR